MFHSNTVVRLAPPLVIIENAVNKGIENIRAALMKAAS
jgi:acetylornithine/succinyldiaminopimelate/putrescine aminotransferase